jgi:hypothetical protein
MAHVFRHNRDDARPDDMSHAVDGHFEFALDDLVDLFLGMEML